VQRFVEEGGRLICMKNSAKFAIRDLGLPLQISNDKASLPNAISPNCVLQINVIFSHPMAFRVKRELDVIFENGFAFEILDQNKAKPIATYSDKKFLISCQVRDQNQIAKKIAIAHVSMGTGHIILFGFSPYYEGKTWGTFNLLFNAIDTTFN
jgi:hypothetical protein